MESNNMFAPGSWCHCIYCYQLNKILQVYNLSRHFLYALPFSVSNLSNDTFLPIQFSVSSLAKLEKVACMAQLILYRLANRHILLTLLQNSYLTPLESFHIFLERS